MHLFYAPGLYDQTEFTLSVEESHHAIRVLRLAPGAEIVLVNGRGGWYQTRITDPGPKACTVEITGMSENVGKPNYDLHIAIAPTKQIDRIEWFIEKATEIGIGEITPLICEHSERKEVKTDRMLRITLAAMKQSMTAFHPVIHEPVSFRKFISKDIPGQRAVAHCEPGDKLWLDPLVKPGEPITILIGPEGDFSPAEIREANANNYHSITLGDSRLRTETAGVVACHTVNWLSRTV